MPQCIEFRTTTSLFHSDRRLSRYATDMPQYQRPHLETRTFFDEAGEAIHYGNRWEKFGGTPPEDRYSVEVNTERFAPLLDVANALIAHMLQHYDVTFEEGPQVAATDFTHVDPDDATVRAIRTTPSDSLNAPIAMRLTDYPTVRVRAGGFFSFVTPYCSCNACDESYEHLANELEWRILAIIAGDLFEHVAKNTTKTNLLLRSTIDESAIGSECYVSGYPAPFIADATERLAALPGHRWRAWPRKQTP